MKSTQFWLLMVLSIAVTCLYFKEITLSRTIVRAQHTLTDDQETADSATLYEKRWQNLALSVYEASKQDPAMADLLKSEGIHVHQVGPETPNPAGMRMAPGASSAPGTSTKPLGGPPLPGHPATP